MKLLVEMDDERYEKFKDLIAGKYDLVASGKIKDLASYLMKAGFSHTRTDYMIDPDTRAKTAVAKFERHGITIRIEFLEGVE